MGYEILAGLLCVVWAALHASVRQHPARVPAEAHSAVYRRLNDRRYNDP